jgi:hypothetical protein
MATAGAGKTPLPARRQATPLVPKRAVTPGKLVPYPGPLLFPPKFVIKKIQVLNGTKYPQAVSIDHWFLPGQKARVAVTVANEGGPPPSHLTWNKKGPPPSSKNDMVKVNDPIRVWALAAIVPTPDAPYQQHLLTGRVDMAAPNAGATATATVQVETGWEGLYQVKAAIGPAPDVLKPVYFGDSLIYVMADRPILRVARARVLDNPLPPQADYARVKVVNSGTKPSTTAWVWVRPKGPCDGLNVWKASGQVPIPSIAPGQSVWSEAKKITWATWNPQHALPAYCASPYEAYFMEGKEGGSTGASKNKPVAADLYKMSSGVDLATQQAFNSN